MIGMRYKLVTFDAIKTLIKQTSPPEAKFAEVAAMYGIPCSREALTNAYPRNYETQVRYHPNFGQKTGIGWEKWWRDLIVKTFRDANCSAEQEKLDIVITQLLDIYKSTSFWAAREGAFGLLSYLNFRRVPIGVMSNFDPRLHEILGNTRMKHYFRFILTSYELGVEKPDIRIFKEAMSRSGMINLKPEECLHIGDCVLADYYAAISNKWKGLLVRNDKSKFSEIHPAVNPRDVFPSLYDILKFMALENRPKPMFYGSRTHETTH